MDFSKIKLYLYWDLDNCRIDKKIDKCNAVRTVKKSLCTCFPHVTIASLNAYTNNLSEEEIEAFGKNGFRVTSVPAGTTNAADASLILDMFRFPLDKPSLVVLVSGDADFCEVFECLRHQGCTTVLLYPINSVATELLSVSDYCFPIQSFWGGHGLPKRNRFLRRRPKKGYMQLYNLQRVILWDIESFPLPSEGCQDTREIHHVVMSSIVALVRKVSTGEGLHVENFLVHAFGKETILPQDNGERGGIRYIVTSNSPKEKYYSVENRMLVDMLYLATVTRVSCHFVILTSKDLSQEAIYFLKSLGHVVTTAVPSSSESLPELGDASNNIIVWPDWKAGAAAKRRVHRAWRSKNDHR
ncbi:meiosis regulator and mRNA stability factor 1-like protein [Tanacetum coccineum]|uniref:Meiosis regulator and mRNA stability factor 1-like protein n=1 Tax=Tanacetum coccineum TaxID=301880 RepID=A0ABQ4XDY1_9ASTR